jgi:hypothetical protein
MAQDNRAGSFQTNLIDGGFEPGAAGAITSAAFHCSTPQLHRGPVKYSYVSPDLRLVDPLRRQFQFPNFDFTSPDTEEEEKEPEEDEVDRPPEIPTEPRSPRAEEEHAQPQGGWGDGQYRAGQYISIDRRTISCRARKRGVAMLTQDEFVGGSITVKGDVRGLVQSFPEGTDFDRVWRIVPLVQPVTVVTGVQMTAAGLRVKRATLLAWKQKDIQSALIPFEKHSNLVDASMDATGLNFKSEDVFYLGPPPVESDPPYFNIPIADCSPGIP